MRVVLLIPGCRFPFVWARGGGTCRLHQRGPPLTIVCEPSGSNLKRSDEVCYTVVIGITKFLLRKIIPTKRQVSQQIGGYTMALLEALLAILGLDSLNKRLTEVIAPSW